MLRALRQNKDAAALGLLEGQAQASAGRQDIEVTRQMRCLLVAALHSVSLASICEAELTGGGVLALPQHVQALSAANQPDRLLMTTNGMLARAGQQGLLLCV